MFLEYKLIAAVLVAGMALAGGHLALRIGDDARGSLEIIDDVFGREARNWLKFAALGLGFALMALLSLWA